MYLFSALEKRTFGNAIHADSCKTGGTGMGKTKWYNMISRFTVETEKPVSPSKHKTLGDYLKVVAEMVGMKITKSEEVET
jgi:hypothetical protein